MKFEDDVLLEKGCYQYELLLEFEFFSYNVYWDLYCFVSPENVVYGGNRCFAECQSCIFLMHLTDFRILKFYCIKYTSTLHIYTCDELFLKYFLVLYGTSCFSIWQFFRINPRSMFANILISRSLANKLNITCFSHLPWKLQYQLLYSLRLFTKAYYPIC